MRATRGVDLGGLGSSTARTLLVGVCSRLPSLVPVVAAETIGRSLYKVVMVVVMVMVMVVVVSE